MNDPETQDDDLVATIQTALAEATPRPWKISGNICALGDLAIRDEAHDHDIAYCLERGHNPKANARLIANAPTWLAALLVKVSELTAEKDKWKSEYQAENQRLNEELARQLRSVLPRWAFDKIQDLEAKVERLEIDKGLLQEKLNDSEQLCKQLEAENQRLREALALYASDESWCYYDGWHWCGPVGPTATTVEGAPALGDPGHTAKIALGLIPED